MYVKHLLTLWRSVVRTLCAAMALSLPLITGSAHSANAGEISIRMAEDIGNIDPAFWQSGADLALINVLFPKLIEFKSDREWDWELSAADSIEQVDAHTISFTLKPGLMWTGDYGEVTAEDVKYSYERYLDKEVNSPNSGDWAPLKEVEVTGKYSGIIHLNKPFAPIWWSTLPFTGGSIVSKTATEAAGGKFTTDPGATAGPYKIEKWTPRESLVLVPHDGWNGTPTGYDRITLIPIQDSKTAEIAYEAGEIQFTDVAIGSVPNYRENLPAGTSLDIRPSVDYTWLGMNIANPKLSDPRVRRAIAMAVDVDTILQGAYFGVPERSTGLVAPGLVGHRDITPPARDVEGAKALLAEAGVSGLELEVEVQSIAERVTAAQIIQANLAEIGISLQINQLDSGAFWNVASEKGDALELTLKNYNSPPDPSWSTQWFVSEQKAIWNWEALENEEFDKLHYDALKESDLEKRTAMYYRMQEIMDETGAFVWLMHPPSALVFQDTVEPGLYPNGRLKLADFRPK